MAFSEEASDEGERRKTAWARLGGRQGDLYPPRGAVAARSARQRGGNGEQLGHGLCLSSARRRKTTRAREADGLGQVAVGLKSKRHSATLAISLFFHSIFGF